MSTHKDINTWFLDQQDAMCDLVKKWSSINSGTSNIEGNRRMLSELQKSFAPISEVTEIIPAKSVSRLLDNGQHSKINIAPILRCKTRPSAPYQILLTGHMDTVFHKDHPFQKVKHIGLDKLHGPGVADMKGGLVVMLYALTAYEKFCHEDSIGWEVLINSDEESGSLGSIDELESSAVNKNIGLIFEPALPNGDLAGQRKGSGNFSFFVQGKAAHAGREHHLGRNAIAALSKAMSAIDDLNGKRENVTFNLGLIKGGQALNVVADQAICRFNVRTESPSDAEWVYSKLQQILLTINKADGFSAIIDGKITRPPKIFDEKHQKMFKLLADCGSKLGLDINHQFSGGCCDGNNLAAVGLANIDSLGVRGGNIHSETEFMIIDSLVERSHLTYLFLNALKNNPL